MQISTSKYLILFIDQIQIVQTSYGQKQVVQITILQEHCVHEPS